MEAIWIILASLAFIFTFGFIWVAFWVWLDRSEAREWGAHVADLAAAAHRQRQDRGRYLTDDPHRPE